MINHIRGGSYVVQNINDTMTCKQNTLAILQDAEDKCREKAAKLIAEIAPWPEETEFSRSKPEPVITRKPDRISFDGCRRKPKRKR